MIFGILQLRGRSSPARMSPCQGEGSGFDSHRPLKSIILPPFLTYMNTILTSLFFLHFLNDGVRTAFVSLLPFIAKDFHLSFTHVGFLGSSQGIVVSIFALPAGILASRIGGFKILLLSLLIYSIGAIGIGLAPNSIALMIIFYLAAAGFGMFHTIANSLVARSSYKTTLGRTMGNYGAISDLGRISLPAGALFLASLIGWRPAFFTLATIGFSTYIFFQWLLPLRNISLHKQRKEGRESHKAWLIQLVFLIRQKQLFLVTLAATVDNFAAHSIYIFLPFLLLARGFTPATLSIFMASYFIGSFGGKTLLGRAVDLFGKAKVFIVAEILMAASLILLTLSHNFFLLLGMSCLLGWFTRGTTPIVGTLFAEITHEAHYEKVFAVGEIFLGLAGALSPIIMGILADRLGVVSVFYMAAFFAIVATIPIFLFLRSPVRY